MTVLDGVKLEIGRALFGLGVAVVLIAAAAAFAVVMNWFDRRRWKRGEK